MQPILLLETSTTVCSVALAGEHSILAFREINEGYAHSENITVFIEEVLTEAGIKMEDLAAVAVSSGPGSYTGLRIGVSTAKGICYALDKPLIAIPTLKAMGAGFIHLTPDPSPKERGERSGGENPEFFVPMIDARRMEVYCSVLDSQLHELEPVTAKIIDADSFRNYLEKGKVHFFGDGATKCSDVIQHQNARFSTDFMPSTRYMIQLAIEKLENGEFENLALFEPYYLKDFVPGGGQNS